MIKNNIKMRVTPEQLIEIGKIIPICKRFTEAKYIFIYKDGSISWGRNEYRFDKKETMQEIDPELFIRTNGSCIEKEEFTYPMWFRSKKWDYIVRFDDLRYGRVVKEGINPKIFKTFTSSGWTAHTDNSTWEQVENPDLVTDKEIEQEESKETLSNMIKQNGELVTLIVN